jgi:hypothetical protein
MLPLESTRGYAAVFVAWFGGVVEPGAAVDARLGESSFTVLLVKAVQGAK